MRLSRTIWALAMIAAGAATQPAWAAAGFECPVPSAQLTKKLEGLLPAGDAFDKVEALNASVDALRAEGVPSALIIDALVSNFCPTVAAQQGLSDGQKSARVSRFAGRAAAEVYSLGSEDEVILDVSFPPQIVNAIEAKAGAAGMTSDQWIRAAVDMALR